MTESVSTSYSFSTSQSAEDRNQLYSELRKKLISNLETKREEEKKKKTDEKEEDKKSTFLSNSDMADREVPFFSNDITAEKQTPFLTNEVNSDNQPFLEPLDTSEKESPLALPQTEEQEDETYTAANITFPKSNDTIISELKRNPLHSTMTIRNIADEYDISYQKAMDIYKTLNEDANGVVREFNLPDENATVSFLV